jgi:TolB-like protein/DNA-binding winged helix-turn-helix (wHTH) protein/Tfp pilus assembly protein PilF
MASPVDDLPSNYRFADLTLDVARRRVTRRGETLELKALDFDLLRFLVAQAPNVVNADVLAEKVWGRHFVSPENVAQRVKLLRQSLSDDANKPRYIETIRNKGYRLIPVVETVRAAQADPARPQWRPRLVSAFAALLVVGAATAYWVGGPLDALPPSPTSIAVLPFENLSPDPENAYFAASMRDEIVSQLTKISGLRVIPVRPLVGAQRTIAELGRDLNVATVLDGSVYYADGNVRVTPRLTDAAAGVSLWANSYERARSDIFEIQADIALDVARALSLELSAAERERVERVPTTNLGAQDSYLFAQTLACCSGDGLRAVDAIEQALQLDPAFKEAWVAKAHIRLNAAAVDPGRAAEHNQLGEQAARRALELDPQFGSAYKALGQALLAKNDWTGAEAAFRNAETLNVPPGERGSEAFLNLSAGKFGPVAREIFEQARAANPQSPLYYRFLMFVYEGLGERDRARGLYEDAMRAFPNDSREMLLMQSQRMHWLIGRNDIETARSMSIADEFNAEMLARLDVPEEALAELYRAFELSGSDNPNRYYDIGLWAGHFGDAELAFEAMRAAADAGGGRMAYMWLPQLVAMRRLPAFEAYMREVRMVEYWENYGWPTFCRPLGQHDLECD